MGHRHIKLFNVIAPRYDLFYKLQVNLFGWILQYNSVII